MSIHALGDVQLAHTQASTRFSTRPRDRPLSDLERNRIYNKILDRDWISVRLFVT